jgi:SAM-dependent methyltransferase
MSLTEEIQQGLDAVTPERRAFLRRAFGMLPDLANPRILDIGCGRGGPTLELARLGGEVTGVDVDDRALRDLAESAEAAGLAERVRVIKASMSELDFPPGSFDLLWAEGSVHAIGFEEALDCWRPLLVPGGHVVIHESAWLQPNPPEAARTLWQSRFPCIRTASEYADAARKLGYEWVGDFNLPADFWWEAYYHPLSERVAALRVKYRGDPAALETLARTQEEIGLYWQHRGWFGSAYLLARKPVGLPGGKGGSP